MIFLINYIIAYLYYLIYNKQYEVVITLKNIIYLLIKIFKT
jgi:hypothetical protein